MDQFRIHFPLERYTNGDFGEIHVVVGETAFPENTWNDFGPLVISGWLLELNRLFLRQTEKVRCKFIDGDFAFDIESGNADGTLVLTFIRETDGPDIIEDVRTVSADSLTSAIVQALETVRDDCERSGNETAVKRIATGIEGLLEARTDFDL